MVQKACCPGYWGSQCYGTEETACPAPPPLCPSPSSSSEGRLYCACSSKAIRAWFSSPGCPGGRGWSRGKGSILGEKLSSWVSTECPGGAETPCNGHGTCLDGIAGNGTCVCQVKVGLG